MVFSSSGDDATTSIAPLLVDANANNIVEGVRDCNGCSVDRYKYGGWRSASFIITVEIAERFAYSGIASNLITYLTGPLHQSTATAAANVNAWFGAVCMLPLLGAFVADSYLGRYRMILFSSLLYVLGLGLLTLSAVLDNGRNTWGSPSFHVFVFFLCLYLIATAQAGHKPCVQAFGADQFDGQDPVESKSKSSFFNWWYFGVCGSNVIAVLIVNYIQDNLNWGLGFGLPCISMAVALVIFLLGRRTYRYGFKEDKKSPFARIGQVFIAAARNRRTISSSPSALKEPNTTSHINHQFRFLDKALTKIASLEDSENDPELCSVTQVEEAKALLRLVPIWATCLIYGIVFAQYLTFFTKQGSTMDRSCGSSFKIPAASLQVFIPLSIVLLIPVYDRVLVPTLRAISGKPSGITMLQRIGCGFVSCGMSMVMAALVEKKRLKTALNFGLVDNPTATVPMSVWWLTPQYIFIGISEVFTVIGLQEFFYDQMPNGLESLGIAIYLSILGAGSFLSGFLVSAIEMATSGDGRHSWFSNNLNRAHLDFFYWLLAGLSAIELAVYLYFTKSYVYKISQ